MISVVVCTYNRATVLKRMLTAFFDQVCLERVDFEMIVINNNSTDRTSEVAREFEGQARFRCVVEPRQGLSAARNRGVIESCGEIIAFLDDDVIVHERWLERLHTCFEETNADVVGGRSYLIFEDDPPAWFGPEFRRPLAEVDLGRERKTLSEDVDKLAGLNLAFRRCTLQNAGGFDESLGRMGSSLLCGEETVLIRRIRAEGGLIVYDSDAVVGHIVGRDRMVWRYFRRLAVGLGKSSALAEDPAGTAAQLARLLGSVSSSLLQTPRLVCKTLAGRSPYQRRVAAHRLFVKLGCVLGHWRRLWRAD